MLRTNHTKRGVYYLTNYSEVLVAIDCYKEDCIFRESTGADTGFTGFCNLKSIQIHEDGKCSSGKFSEGLCKEDKEK